jgi:hypothetical protein
MVFMAGSEEALPSRLEVAVDPLIALAVFPIIFIAELPDKTITPTDHGRWGRHRPGRGPSDEPGELSGAEGRVDHGRQRRGVALLLPELLLTLEASAGVRHGSRSKWTKRIQNGLCERRKWKALALGARGPQFESGRPDQTAREEPEPNWPDALAVGRACPPSAVGQEGEHVASGVGKSFEAPGAVDEDAEASADADVDRRGSGAVVSHSHSVGNPGLAL